MYIIKKSNLFQLASKHPDSISPVNTWIEHVISKVWFNHGDVKKDYSSADRIGDVYVFNIKGNSYRLIVWIKFSKKINGETKEGKIYIRDFITHAEYSKIKNIEEYARQGNF